MKNSRWKLILIIGIILTASLLVLPTIHPNIWPYKKINLGLDLKGGMQVIIAVDTNQAIKSYLDQTSKEIQSYIKKNQIESCNLEIFKGKKIFLLLKNKNDSIVFTSIIKNEFPDLKLIECKPINDSFFKITIELDEKKTKQISKLTVGQALETIRNRIDQFGVNEPEIRQHGLKQILIQLPGVTDIKRAKELIGRTAILEFRIVDLNQDLELYNKNILTSNSIIIYKRKLNKKDNIQIPIIVSKYSPLTGAHLVNARVSINTRDNTPQVLIKLNKLGSKIFEKLTRENNNRQLAIILDNNIYCTPYISETIKGGEAVISGGFNIEEARDLAIALRAGSLPAPVKIIEERTVGPSLGLNSIKAGISSMLIGSIIVIIFMLFYYKISGLIANLALLLNILIITAGLALFQATLTFPGIAGIILTTGMAVDANVLIFERIKDEIKLKKPLINSIYSGYSKASITILDANITTIIAALVLFNFGSGPIKGFCITLILGVVSSLFTSLVVTRMLLDYILNNFKIKKYFLF